MLTHPYNPFFILHSSFKQATVSATLPADIPSPNCHFIQSAPDKMKNIKTETYDFQSFMTLSQEK